MEKVATRNSAAPNLAIALVNLLSGTVDKSAFTVQRGATAVEECQLDLSRLDVDENTIIYVAQGCIVVATNCKLSTAGACLVELELDRTFNCSPFRFVDRQGISFLK